MGGKGKREGEKQRETIETGKRKKRKELTIDQTKNGAPPDIS